MDKTSMIGAGTMGLPMLLAFAWMFWRKLRWIFWFATACLLVGLGYLTATGAARDVGARVEGMMKPAGVPTPKPVTR